MAKLLFFSLEFPGVENFFHVSECRFRDPFVGDPFVFPSAFVH